MGNEHYSVGSHYTVGSDSNDEPTDYFEDEESSEEDEGESEELIEDVKEVVKTPEELFGGPHEEHAGGLKAHYELDEKELSGGMNIYPDLYQAFKKTFTGWPKKLDDFEPFRARAEAALAKRKINKLRPDAFEALLEREYSDVGRRLNSFLDMNETYRVFRGMVRMSKYHAGILKIMSRGMNYWGEAKRNKYLIEIGPVLTRGGDPFDTGELRDRKSRTSAAGSFSSNDKTSSKRCIWVMAGDNTNGYKFYSHVGKIARTHHSSFTAGGSVIAAGEWYVKRGRIKLINGLSGHYMPDAERFLRALYYLNKKGAIDDKATVLAFNDSGPQEIYAISFLNNSANVLQTCRLFP
jgi:hypothetical protein